MPNFEPRHSIWIEGMPWWVLPLIGLLTIQPIMMIVRSIAGEW